MSSILVVEDEMSYRELLKKKLEKEGYTVLTAEDGDKALDILKNQDVDLILLDLAMPKMDGRTFYYHLTMGLKKNIPTIILTNSSESAYQTDIKEFLIKANTSLDQLVAKVKEYLN